jgi:hypothetical protein
VQNKKNWEKGKCKTKTFLQGKLRFPLPFHISHLFICKIQDNRNISPTTNKLKILLRAKKEEDFISNSREIIMKLIK